MTDDAWAVGGVMQGDGSAEDPYRIEDQADLAAIGTGSYNAGANYFMVNDVNMTGTWTPIASFSGILDGDGHIVSNLFVDIKGNNGGLFAHIQGVSETNCAEVKNLIIEGSVSANQYAGGLAGTVNNAKITNVGNRADIITTSTSCYAGGIVGSVCSGNDTYYSSNSAYAEIRNCFNEGRIGSLTEASGSYLGGIVGVLHGSTGSPTVVKGCYNIGQVDGSASSYSCGGVVGTANTMPDYFSSVAKAAQIENSYSLGAIAMADGCVGGVLGSLCYDSWYPSYSDNLTCTNCYSDIVPVGTDSPNLTAKLPDTVAEYAADAMQSEEFLARINAGLDTPAFVRGLYHPVLEWEGTGIDPDTIYITKQPSDATYQEGTLSFDVDQLSIETTVEDATYQWCVVDEDGEWSPLQGQTTNTLNLGSYLGFSLKEGTYSYGCIVNALDKEEVRSNVATVKVMPKGTEIAIGSTSESVTVKQGVSTRTLSVEVTNLDQLIEEGYDVSYQWQVMQGYSYVDIPKATANSYKAIFDELGTYRYKCVINAISATNYSTKEFVSTNVYAPRTISTAEDFNEFAGLVNSGVDFAGMTVSLENDLVLEETIAPIGTYLTYGGKPFNGIFDGKNHTLTANITGSGAGIAATALFAYINGGTVKNITFAGSVIANSKYAGGVIAYGENVKLENVANTADVVNSYKVGSGVSAYARTGGLIGLADNADIEGCWNSGSIIATSGIAGALVGGDYNGSKLTLLNSYNIGGVSAFHYAGGLIGYSSLSTISMANCYNAGSVPEAANGWGALLGSGDSYYLSNSDVTNCYFDQDVCAQASTASISGCIGVSTAELKQVPQGLKDTHVFLQNGDGYPVLGVNAPETPEQPEPVPTPTPTPKPTPAPSPTPGEEIADDDNPLAGGGETVTAPDGTVVTTMTDGNGTVTQIIVDLAEGIASPYTLPIDPVAAGSDCIVEINATRGTVCVIPIASASSLGNAVASIDADGKASVIRKSVVTDAGVAFIAPEGTVRVKVVSAGNSFPDVTDNDWFAKTGIVEFVTARSLITGVAMPEGARFMGNDSVTRAMFATILHRLESEEQAQVGKTFTDVAAGMWYTDAIDWASAKKIVMGYGDGDAFGPNDPITREQLAVMLQRYAASLGIDTSNGADLSKYADASQLTFGKDAMSWAVGAGLLQGYGNSDDLGGANGATRAEVATILERLVRYQLGL